MLRTMAAIAAMMMTTGTAEAQRYYARRHLVPATAPAITYAPNYGAWSVCTNSKRSATLSTCTRSDGKTVTNTFCSAFPKTKTEDCVTTYVCDPVVPGYFLGSNDGGGGYTGQSIARTAGWEQRAADICSNALRSNPTMNVCTADTAQGRENTLDIALFKGTIVSANSTTYYAASSCRVQ